jgi:hypothetical protein
VLNIRGVGVGVRALYKFIKSPLGSFGVLWGPLGSFGILWGPLGSFGVLWGPLGSFGVLLGSLEKPILGEGVHCVTKVTYKGKGTSGLCV